MWVAKVALLQVCAGSRAIACREARPAPRIRNGDRDLLKTGITTVQKWVISGTVSEPDVVLHATWISVWGRWFVWLVGIFLLAYRPSFWYPEGTEFLAIPVTLLIANGLVHFRLLTNRPVTWRWLLFLGTVDVALTTYGVFIAGGFNSFIFLSYYPALAVFAVVFSSRWVSIASTTIAAVAYTVVCLVLGPGLDLEAGQERVLVARLAVLYIIVLGVNLITRFERNRWQTAVARERHLRQERIEVSQTIHDTTAQTAYMIGLGIHRARELADQSNEELVAALDATRELSMSAMWEMRGPIDSGHLLEGRGLGRVLWSHCSTFERITAIPTEMAESGTEPPLPTETRARLFSVAHNALTNAFLHSRASRVQVRLSFELDQIRLSVSDDGVGLPTGYDERGRGFNGMTADAEQMGGRLIVESAGGGTTITCEVPRDTDKGGRSYAVDATNKGNGG